VLSPMLPEEDDGLEVFCFSFSSVSLRRASRASSSRLWDVTACFLRRCQRWVDRMEERVLEGVMGKAERMVDTLLLHGLGEPFQGAVHGKGLV
jgi:hypothetical protein